VAQVALFADIFWLEENVVAIRISQASGLALVQVRFALFQALAGMA